MRVAIIGAGIAGLSSAWALTREGIDVTLFEQGEIPNPLSASGDHHRIIRRAYGHQGGYQRQIDEAFEAWQMMFDDIGTNHLAMRGFLLVSQQAGDEADRLRLGLARHGDPHECLQPDEARVRWPFLHRSTISEVTFSPEGGALLCRRIAHDLLVWLTSQGATIRERTRVLAIDRKNGTVDTAASSEIFDEIILTAGAWVLELAPELKETLTPWRTAVAYLDPPGDLQDAWAAAPVILDTGGDSDGYVLPPVNGTGLKFGTGRHKYISSPDLNRAVTADEGSRILSWFANTFDRIDEYRIREVISCAYTFTSDEHFLGRRDHRMTIVSACSGHGYKFGAAIGRRVARSLLDKDFATLSTWLEARDR